MAESARVNAATATDAQSTDVDIAIGAFHASDLPDNRALADFIGRHAARLTPPQRQAVQRLVTWPVRGPERSGGDLGMTALLHFAESEEVAAMWSRWIRSGAFDGTPCSPAELAAYLVEAQRRRVPGLERLAEALRTHVRTTLRSNDIGRINTALTHVDVCARAGASIAVVLVREAHAAFGSADWQAWLEREPDVALRIREEVEAVADEAARQIASGTCGAG